MFYYVWVGVQHYPTTVEGVYNTQLSRELNVQSHILVNRDLSGLDWQLDGVRTIILLCLTLYLDPAKAGPLGPACLPVCCVDAQ
jgi:hypothetical protein